MEDIFEPSDYIKRLREEQERLREMFKTPDYIQKMIEEQEYFRRMAESPEYIQKMIEEQESLRKMAEPPEYMRKIIEEQESLRRMVEPPENIRKIIEEQEAFREMFTPQGSAVKTLQSLLSHRVFDPIDITERIKGLAGELSIPDFHVNGDGSIYLEEQSIDVSELSTIVRTFFEDIPKGSSVEIIFSHLKTLKKPAQRIAIWILNQIIISNFRLGIACET